eukprot:scaffold25717_cov65-Phaeocystis_antarctica.AAC.5
MPSFAIGRGASCESNRGRLRAKQANDAPPHEPRRLPRWGCEEFLGAAARHSHQLWHPVKDRSCWTAYLDACDATGCHAPAPPLQPYCREADGYLHKCTPGGARQLDHLCLTNCSAVSRVR